MGKNKKYPGIYLITNLLDKKIYVGYSRNCLKRMQDHRNRLRAGLHKNLHLQNAWNLHSANSFSFNIIEHLSNELTNTEFETIETKWIFFYKSNQKEFGYNKCLPGSIPLKEKNENITRTIIPRTTYICINIKSKINYKVIGAKEVFKLTNIKITKVSDLCSYWKNSKGKKSLYNWMIVREEDYDSEFDYINYRKIRVKQSTKTWRDYELTRKIKYQKVKNVIPVEKRNLKRVSIIATNILTKEEIIYSMIKECAKDFLITKVYKCINNEYGKYSHRGYYFKRA